MTKNNTTSNTNDTHALVDLTEREILATGTRRDAMIHIAEWNAHEGTNYNTLEQFNAGEEFYAILPLWRAWQIEGAQKEIPMFAGTMDALAAL
jgi:hypothetical protein